MLDPVRVTRGKTTVVSRRCFHAWGFSHIDLRRVQGCTVAPVASSNPESPSTYRPSPATGLCVVPVMFYGSMALPDDVRRRYSGSAR